MFWEKRFKKVEEQISTSERTAIHLREYLNEEVDKIYSSMRSLANTVDLLTKETHDNHNALFLTFGDVLDKINGVVGDTSKTINSVRDNINNRITKLANSQDKVNDGQNEINKSLLDQIEKLTNKVDVLVETHHNVSMFHNLISGRAKKS